MSSRPDEEVVARDQVLRVAAGLTFAVGMALALALVYQSVDVYFKIGGQTVIPTAAEKARFVWTAGAGLLAMTGCLVLALIVRSRPLAGCGFIGLVVVVVLAGLLPVPKDRWHADPPTHDMPDHYTPCYSGSQDCGAGG